MSRFKAAIATLSAIVLCSQGLAIRWHPLTVPPDLQPHSFPTYAIHLVLLRSGDTLAFSLASSQPNTIASTQNAHVIGGLLDTIPHEASVSIVTLLGGSPGDPPLRRNHRNLFCSGHYVLPDGPGTVLFAGGDDFDSNVFSPSQFGFENSGARTLMMFRPDGGSYTSPWAQLHDNPSTDPAQTWASDPSDFQLLLNARWYPSLTLAGTGRFLVSAGSGETGPAEKVQSFEALTVKTRDGGFIPSAHLSLVPWMSFQFGASNHISKNYPFIWPIKNQEVTSNQLLTRDHHWMLMGQDVKSLRLPLATLAARGHWGEHNDSNWGLPTSLPAFGYTYPAGAWIDGRALVCGGANGASAPATPNWTFIDTNTPSPTYTNSSSTTRMKVPRQNHGLVILPNNTFMAIGGNINGLVQYSTTGATALSPASNDWPFLNTATTHAHNRPEFFDPVTKTWSMPAGNEHVLPLPLRPYHTTALLLPNGYVFVGGGEDASDGLPASAQTHNYLYKPSYIPANEADRPVITVTTEPGGVMFYDKLYQVAVSLPAASDVRRIMFISLGSMTHSFDMGQRGYTMTMEGIPPDGELMPGSQSFSGGFTLVGAVTPRDPWYMPPGWYMAFAEDTSGFVSKAQVVRIIERYSIDLPIGPFQVKTGSGWNQVNDIKPLIHGDAVYESASINNDWGGIYGNYLHANNLDRMVEMVTANPSLRVKSPFPLAVNLSLNKGIRVKLEARTNLSSVVPTFRIRSGSTWYDLSLQSSMPAGLFRQLGKGERYREYFLTPTVGSTNLARDPDGTIEVEVTFPGASEAHVDMIQVGGYLQTAPY